MLGAPCAPGTGSGWPSGFTRTRRCPSARGDRRRPPRGNPRGRSGLKRTGVGYMARPPLARPPFSSRELQNCHKSSIGSWGPAQDGRGEESGGRPQASKSSFRWGPRLSVPTKRRRCVLDGLGTHIHPGAIFVGNAGYLAEFYVPWSSQRNGRRSGSGRGALGSLEGTQRGRTVLVMTSLTHALGAVAATAPRFCSLVGWCLKFKQHTKVPSTAGDRR